MATKKKKATVEPEETTSFTVDDIPGSIFDSNVVRATSIRNLQEMEDRHNFNRRVHFLGAVANWVRLLTEQPSFPRGPVPQPPLKLHYIWVEKTQDTGSGISNDPVMVEGPEFVAEPYVPPVKPTLPEGIVAFGFDSDDGTGSYYVGPTNTVRPGTHAMKDGKEYVFVVIGRLGTLVYRKMWVPVGS